MKVGESLIFPLPPLAMFCYTGNKTMRVANDLMHQNVSPQLRYVKCSDGYQSAVLSDPVWKVQLAKLSENFTSLRHRGEHTRNGIIEHTARLPWYQVTTRLSNAAASEGLTRYFIGCVRLERSHGLVRSTWKFP